jgi:hypothetical protein
MQMDKFTIKAAEALQGAQQLAESRGTPRSRRCTCSPPC